MPNSKLPKQLDLKLKKKLDKTEIARLREYVSITDCRVLALTMRHAVVRCETSFPKNHNGKHELFIIRNEIDPKCEVAMKGEGELRVMRSSVEKHKIEVK